MDLFAVPAFWMFPALFLMVFAGFPVAFSLITLAFFFGYDFFGDRIGLQFFGRIHDVLTNYSFAAVPLFVFMGAMLERSGIAERLFHAMQLWVGRLPGGLALATLLMCAVFAAATGIVGAVEAVVGMMAAPAMLRQRYAKDLISGTICAGGSLGTIIPPSLVVVIYATVVEISIGDLFAGIIIPGLLMVVLFVAYVLIRCARDPASGPPADASVNDVPLGDKLRITATALVPVVLLVIAVLGSILAGVASPTEAAGVGAAGAVLLTIVYGNFSAKLLFEVLRRSVIINAMIMLVVIGGTLFTSIFLINGGSRMVDELLVGTSPEAWQVIVLFLLVIFVLGFVLDWVSVVLICMPIFTPVLRELGVDPLWFGVMVCVVIQTSYLTPPMAPAIFYFRAIAPREITYAHMFRGVLPFIACQLIVLAVVAAWPPTATYLAGVLFRF
ncbi:MAG: TRAP transporter large permease [Pseudomonadota bacterium]